MEKYTPAEAIIEAEKIQQKISSNEAKDYPDAEQKIVADEAKLAEMFQSELNNILATPLRPENIDTYARDAVDGIVKFIDRILAEYAREAPDGLSKQQFEDLAFKHYGLSGINKTLDYIAQKEKEINNLDKVIEGALQLDTVVVPTKNQQSSIVPGEGSFKEKLTIPRTKIILFILANDFDINIEDPGQLSLTTGTLKDNMMRKLSYTMVNIPNLGRTVLCCDEEENVTYVFDSKLLEKKGISSDKLASYSKSGLDRLINDNQHMGSKVRYSKYFTPNITRKISSLEADAKTTDEENENEDESYLYEKAPEGFLSAFGIAKKYNISHGTVTRCVAALEEDLGIIKKFRFSGKVFYGFSPEQQQIIESEITKTGVLAEKASKDVLSLNGLAKKISMDREVLLKHIHSLNTDLGPVNRYRFGSVYVEGYTPRQQEIIQSYLEANNLAGVNPPEGYFSGKGLANEFGINQDAVTRIIKELGNQLGPVSIYRFGGMDVPGYSPEQKALIEKALEGKGSLSQNAPDEVKSLAKLSQDLGLSITPLKRAVDALGDVIGPVSQYKFGSKVAPGYSPQQQEIIKNWLEGQSTIVEKSTPNIKSINEIANELNISNTTVMKSARELESEIGPLKTFLFGTNRSYGLNKDQVQVLITYLEQKGTLITAAPVGVRSELGISNYTKIGRVEVKKAITALEGTLGPIKSYKFGGVITCGYSQTQQDMILAYLEKAGYPKG